MARFRGVVGFGKDEETSPDVFKTVITEKTLSGTIEQDTRRLSGNGPNQNLSLENVFSLVGTAYAFANFTAIRYIEWAGSLWCVTSVRVERPRLILRIGEVYNGPKV